MSTSRLPVSHPQLANTLERLPAAALLCAAGLLLGVVMAGTQALDVSDRALRQLGVGGPAVAKAEPDQRVREGAEIVDQSGYFRAGGDRLTFFSTDGRQRYQALENLCLQRIAQAVADSPEPVQWTISGMLTEYRGANYLLIRRAVVKSAAARK